jgi:hypothetical protein
MNLIVKILIGVLFLGLVATAISGIVITRSDDSSGPLGPILIGVGGVGAVFMFIGLVVLAGAR